MIAAACLRRDGKTRLKSYWSGSEAEIAAETVMRRGGRDLVPYRCSRCENWHLEPRARRTPCRPCPHCVSSRGTSKQSYETREGARRRAEIREAEGGPLLSVYDCPDGYGWHLTKG